MKRRTVFLALLLALSLAICANAATLANNNFSVDPDLVVTSGRSDCYLDVDTDNPSTTISAIVELQVKTSSGSYTKIGK